MKTIYRFIILFAVLFLWTGCVQEEIAEEFSVEISARMEAEPDTRTSLSGLENGMYYALWETGDVIAVYVDEDADPSKFYLKSGDGTTVASFTGTRKGEDYLAVYPYDIAGSVSDGSLSVTLPATQKYVKDSFGPGAFPMVAKGTAEDGLHFMNLCSVLKITLTGTAAVRSVTLTANDEDTFMSGPATVVTDYTSSTEDFLTMSAEGSPSVVLETKGLEIAEDAPADVFIVIPSQAYEGGFTIEVDTYTEKVTKTVSSDIIFERSQIRAITNFELDSEVPDIIPEAIPDNEIWYVMSDESVYDVYQTTELYGHQPFDAKVISNTYENGKGIIRFDAPVTAIYDHTFGNSWAANMTELYLPDCVEYLGTGAIRSTGLTEFRVPKNLKRIDSYGLNNQNMVKFTGIHVSEDGRSVVINNTMYAFAPKGIKEYIVPDGVQEVSWYAMAWSDELEVVSFPESVVSILGEAVGRCHNLRIVNLPGSLESLDSYAFLECPSIEGFFGNEKFHTSDNRCLKFEMDNPYVPQSWLGTWICGFAGNGLTEYTIPEGIKGIENYTFQDEKDLISVTLPSSLVEVGAYAFYNCPNLEAVYGPNTSEDNRSIIFGDTYRLLAVKKGLKQFVVPDNVKNIGYCAFAECQELETITMGDQVEVIDGYAFAFSPSLKSVTLSANFRSTNNGYNLFLNSDNLEEVYFRSLVPPDYYDSQMSEFPKLKMYVPEQSLELYKRHGGWAQYKKYMVGYHYDDLPGGNIYISSDFSLDGVVETLQTATTGNGIDIVLMGDAYSDREIADGSYEADMEYMYDNLFTQEPFKTHKDMFNVYYVNVVSATEGYDNAGAALGGYFGDGTLVGGNDNKCFEYALKAISEDEMDEALIIVAMNSDAYAGTCYMYYPESATGDYGSGPAVAYFPKGGDQTTFAQLLHHEANGHGFAKLADEYAYEDMGAVPTDYVTQIRNQQNNWGWWKNVDFTSDPEQVRWSYFLEDERYANEGLGVFEGGLTYWSGVWRPTEDSIMRYNTGGFNAPSREAIYYRIHKLVYGDSWEYDYEDFVEYDVVNRSTSASAPQRARRNYVERPLEPTAAPVVVGKSWRDAE